MSRTHHHRNKRKCKYSNRAGHSGLRSDMIGILDPCLDGCKPCDCKGRKYARKRIRQKWRNKLKLQID